MYTEYFGLKEMPFAAEPNLRLLVLNEDHREALATMVYAIDQQEGWALIVGEPGVGKTTLIMALLRELGERVIPAVITNPKLTPLDFMNQVALEMGLEGPFISKGPFLAMLGQFISRCRLQGKKVLLVVDEAQDLSAEMVEELRLLGNLDTNSPRVLNILLVGQPELIRVLKRSASRALLQRLHRNYALKPLNPTASAEYIRQRLTLSGAQREIFEPDALETVYEVTKGVPRLINAVCDDSLLLAYSNEVGKVDRELVLRASRDNPALDLYEEYEPSLQAPAPLGPASTEAAESETPVAEKPAQVMQAEAPASAADPAAAPEPPPAHGRPRLGRLSTKTEPASARPKRLAKPSLEGLEIDHEPDEPETAKRGILSRFAASLSRNAPGSAWKRALVLAVVLAIFFGGYFGGRRAYHWVKVKVFGQVQLFLPDEDLPGKTAPAVQERRQDWGPQIKDAMVDGTDQPTSSYVAPSPTAPRPATQSEPMADSPRPSSQNDD